MCDYSYHDRLRWLAELMLAHPNSKMRSLQKSALRVYPAYGTELHRYCMSARFALRAADVANKLGGY